MLTTIYLKKYVFLGHASSQAKNIIYLFIKYLKSQDLETKLSNEYLFHSTDDLYLYIYFRASACECLR